MACSAAVFAFLPSLNLDALHAAVDIKKFAVIFIALQAVWAALRW